MIVNRRMFSPKIQSFVKVTGPFAGPVLIFIVSIVPTFLGMMYGSSQISYICSILYIFIIGIGLFIMIFSGMEYRRTHGFTQEVPTPKKDVSKVLSDGVRDSKLLERDNDH